MVLQMNNMHLSPLIVAACCCVYNVIIKMLWYYMYCDGATLNMNFASGDLMLD